MPLVCVSPLLPRNWGQANVSTIERLLVLFFGNTETLWDLEIWITSGSIINLKKCSCHQTLRWNLTSALYNLYPKHYTLEPRQELVCSLVNHDFLWVEFLWYFSELTMAAKSIRRWLVLIDRALQGRHRRPPLRLLPPLFPSRRASSQSGSCSHRCRHWHEISVFRVQGSVFDLYHID